MSALATARRPAHDSLWDGRRLRCPRCKTVSEALSYFVFDRPKEHEDELNVVYKCRAKVRNERTGKLESCRCIFSIAGQDAVDELTAEGLQGSHE